MSQSEQLQGSIVALVTPFNHDESIDHVALAQLAQWHVEEGTSAIVVCGTTGESSALSDDEIVEATQTVLNAVGGQVPVVVGNGTISTSKSIALTRKLNPLPIAGYLTVTPYYVKPPQAGLVAHFTAIADIAEHPVFLYNVPGRTGCDLSLASVRTLAEHKNIVGIKDATGDLGRAKELIEANLGQFILLSGDDPTALAFMTMGGQGVISVTANVAPRLMAQRSDALRNNDLRAAEAIDQNLSSLHQDLFVEANPIPVKWALAEMQKINNVFRLPLVAMKEQYQEKVRSAMIQAGV